jgi:hypothetical protein
MRCQDCRKTGHAFPHRLGSGGYVWLCGSCAYRRKHPDAPPPAAAPWERRPLPLQSERLF